MGLNKLLADVSALVNTFNGKKAEIDAAVLSAQTAVLANNKNYYVDPVAGLDTNAGTQAAPFKTLKKACDSVPIGGYGVITIIGDSTSVADIPVDIYLTCKTIFIRSIYSITDNKNLFPVLRNNPQVVSGSIGSTGFFMRQSMLALSALRIETAAWPDDSLPPATTQEGFIKRYDTSSQRVMIMGCRLTINDTPFVKRPVGPAIVEYGSYDLDLHKVSPHRDAPVFHLEYMPAVIGASNTILPAGTTWSDHISGIKRHPATGIPLNVTSNLDLSATPD